MRTRLTAQQWTETHLGRWRNPHPHARHEKYVISRRVSREFAIIRHPVRPFLKGDPVGFIFILSSYIPFQEGVWDPWLGGGIIVLASVDWLTVRL